MDVSYSIQDATVNPQFVVMTIWLSRNLRSRGDSQWEIRKEYCIKTSSNICFGYLLESPHWGDSNKYPKHMLYEGIRIKQGLSYVSFSSLRILYNSKFILMTASLWINVVAVTRANCISGQRVLKPDCAMHMVISAFAVRICLEDTLLLGVSFIRTSIYICV